MPAGDRGRPGSARPCTRTPGEASPAAHTPAPALQQSRYPLSLNFVFMFLAFNPDWYVQLCTVVGLVETNRVLGFVP